LVKALPTQYEVLSKEAENSTCAIVVTEARNPYLITYVNTAWSNITGFTKEDVVGKTLEMIQGPKTDVQKMKEIALAAASGKEMRVEMVNYDKDQKSFRTHLRSKQLTSSSNPNGFIMTAMYKIRDF
jgi:PAS domain S-box-containing protein